MSDGFCERFGSVYEEDAQVIEATLMRLVHVRTVKWLEIGMFRGGTAFGVKKFLNDHGCELEFWGIDAGFITDPAKPFPDAHVIKGRSEEVYPLVPNDFHGIFIDGCHCRNHVILDAINYAPKIVTGGFMLFHDTSPLAQGRDRQPCGIDCNIDTPEFAISLTSGLKMINFPTPGWVLFMERHNPTKLCGGTTSYCKLPL